jgi:integrase
MQITIFPKSPDKKKQVRLFLFCSINNKQGFFPTKIKVNELNWNKENQRITSKQKDYKKLNILLTKRIGQLNKVFEDLEYEGTTPSVEIVRQRYNATLKNKTIKQGKIQIQLFEYFEQYVSDRKATRSWRGYLRHFKFVSDHLKTFNPALQFKDITHQFHHEFVEYLVSEADVENNTVWNYMKKLKSVMGAALLDQRTRFQDIPIDFKVFKDTYIKSKPFFLDWSEVEKIEKAEVTPIQQRYKDEFLFRCYTGLRHVDVFNLRPENFIRRREKVYLDFMSIKTRTDQNLELNSKAVSILEKWNGKPPKLYQSECNTFVREICKAAKINKMVERVRYSGKDRNISLLPKYALVTTHTARRTFGRHWMEQGGTLRLLSIYYGHSSEKQTADYVGWTTEEVNNEMRRLFK